jgi:histidine triad (HIT) family protein
MRKCIFCSIINNEVPSYKIWEDQNFCAFLDINPVNTGHTLLIPKAHIEYIFDMDEFLYSKIFQVARFLSKPINDAMESKRIGVAIEGFGVPHVHIHLVPINKLSDLDPHKAKAATSEELFDVAEKIKGRLKSFDLQRNG